MWFVSLDRLMCTQGVYENANKRNIAIFFDSLCLDVIICLTHIHASSQISSFSPHSVCLLPSTISRNEWFSKVENKILDFWDMHTRCLWKYHKEIYWRKVHVRTIIFIFFELLYVETLNMWMKILSSSRNKMMEKTKTKTSFCIYIITK